MVDPDHKSSFKTFRQFYNFRFSELNDLILDIARLEFIGRKVENFL